MQFGCLAFAAIIQVSDHPVAPSLGSTVLTVVFLPALIVFALSCQAVPMTEVPDSNAETSLSYAAQYSLMFFFCAFSRAMAASSCLAVSEYGSLIFRSGL